jgi:hypothetical protein
MPCKSHHRATMFGDKDLKLRCGMEPVQVRLLPLPFGHDSWLSSFSSTTYLKLPAIQRHPLTSSSSLARNTGIYATPRDTAALAKGLP